MWHHPCPVHHSVVIPTIRVRCCCRRRRYRYRVRHHRTNERWTNQSRPALGIATPFQSTWDSYCIPLDTFASTAVAVGIECYRHGCSMPPLQSRLPWYQNPIPLAATRHRTIAFLPPSSAIPWDAPAVPWRTTYTWPPRPPFPLLLRRPSW